MLIPVCITIAFIVSVVSIRGLIEYIFKVKYGCKHTFVSHESTAYRNEITGEPLRKYIIRCSLCGELESREF